MYDDEYEQQRMHDGRMRTMQQQLNQVMGGELDLAGRLAAWRYQPSSPHTVFRGEDQQSEAAMSTQEQALNLPISPSSTSAIPPTKSGIARTEYMLTLMDLNRMTLEQLNLENDDEEFTIRT